MVFSLLDTKGDIRGMNDQTNMSKMSKIQKTKISRDGIKGEEFVKLNVK